MIHSFGDNDRCTRCGVRYVRQASIGLRAPAYACQPRWARVLNAFRAEKEEARDTKAELAELETMRNADTEVTIAADALAKALHLALGHENVLDEAHDLFQIRRLLDRLDEALQRCT